MRSRSFLIGSYSGWLPTGAGKTACVDIALFALACQAALPAPRRTAPRRIVFVVDRRVIVDEAFEHAVGLAERLTQQLETAEQGILYDVARALVQIAGHEAFAEPDPHTGEPVNSLLAQGVPLTCHQLRGGMYRDDAWSRTPLQPCVIASTVDQIGSRLLFRGYGSSPQAWPKLAGLVSQDTLIILDEAHCANPFLQTLRAVSQYRSADWTGYPLPRGFRHELLSLQLVEHALPPHTAGDDTLDRDLLLQLIATHHGHARQRPGDSRAGHAIQRNRLCSLRELASQAECHCPPGPTQRRPSASSKVANAQANLQRTAEKTGRCFAGVVLQMEGNAAGVEPATCTSGKTV